MAQWLRVLASLAENLGLGPSINMVNHKHLELISRRLDTFFWLLQEPSTHSYPREGKTFTHINKHVQKKSGTRKKGKEEKGRRERKGEVPKDLHREREMLYS